MSDNNKFFDVYLYIPWVAWLGLPTDLGILLFSLFFFLLISFFLFLFFYFSPQERLFTMVLGFLVLLMAWCSSQGMLCNSSKVSLFSFVFSWSTCLLEFSSSFTRLLPHWCHPLLIHKEGSREINPLVPDHVLIPMLNPFI